MSGSASWLPKENTGSVCRQPLPRGAILTRHVVLTSCTASPRLLMPSMSFTLQPSQKSAVSTRWERGRGRMSSAGSVLPSPRGKPYPAHLAGPVPVHPRDNNIAEVLQLLSTALSISALVLEVQLLGQRALQVLGVVHGQADQSGPGLAVTMSWCPPPPAPARCGWHRPGGPSRNQSWGA